MPAIGSRAALERTRPLRFIGLVLTLFFIASVGAVWATPVEAKNWTPQIQTTRRAQIYWEAIMRSADAELRSLKRSQKRTQRKLKSTKANLRKAVTRRAAAKRRLKDARTELAQTRKRRAAEAATTPLPPDAALALQSLMMSPRLPGLLVVPFPDPVPGPDPLATSGSTAIVDEPSVDASTIRKLERKTKRAKRAFDKAKRKAKRNARNTTAVKRRLVSLKAATRHATARRASAERSLGAWILGMTKYGRIRATKKSDARPGLNSPFSWPVRGSISQSYHAGHDGIDIVRYNGAPVRAMAFGVVTYVGWNPWDQHGRAFMVVVTHAGGYETLYGHLKPRRVVRVGEEVRKGHVVGYMGNTGNSTGTHLHLELRRGRTTLNPLGVL